MTFRGSDPWVDPSTKAPDSSNKRNLTHMYRVGPLADPFRGCSRPMKRILTLSLLILLASFQAQATHISGGEIYYNCLGNNQYQVTLIIYRDCAGVNLDPSFNATFSSPWYSGCWARSRGCDGVPASRR